MTIAQKLVSGFIGLFIVAGIYLFITHPFLMTFLALLFR